MVTDKVWLKLPKLIVPERGRVVVFARMENVTLFVPLITPEGAEIEIQGDWESACQPHPGCVLTPKL